MSDDLARRDEHELVVNPVTGEIIRTDDTIAVCEALDALGELRDRISEFRTLLQEVLITHSIQQGTKTLRFGNYTATVYGGEPVYDVDGLFDRLRDAGLSEERLDELIKAKVEYRVDGNVARQLRGANPAYAAALEEALTGHKRVGVSVKRGGR